MRLCLLLVSLSFVSCLESFTTYDCRHCYEGDCLLLCEVGDDPPLPPPPSTCSSCPSSSFCGSDFCPQVVSSSSSSSSPSSFRVCFDDRPFVQASLLVGCNVDGTGGGLPPFSLLPSSDGERTLLFLRPPTPSVLDCPSSSSSSLFLLSNATECPLLDAKVEHVLGRITPVVCSPPSPSPPPFPPFPPPFPPSPPPLPSSPPPRSEYCLLDTVSSSSTNYTFGSQDGTLSSELSLLSDEGAVFYACSNLDLVHCLDVASSTTLEEASSSSSPVFGTSCATTGEDRCGDGSLDEHDIAVVLMSHMQIPPYDVPLSSSTVVRVEDHFSDEACSDAVVKGEASVSVSHIRSSSLSVQIKERRETKEGSCGGWYDILLPPRLVVATLRLSDSVLVDEKEEACPRKTTLVVGEGYYTLPLLQDGGIRIALSSPSSLSSSSPTSFSIWSSTPPCLLKDSLFLGPDGAVRLPVSVCPSPLSSSPLPSLSSSFSPTSSLLPQIGLTCDDIERSYNHAGCCESSSSSSSLVEASLLFSERPNDMLTRFVSALGKDTVPILSNSSALSVAGWTCDSLLDGYDLACCGGTKTPSLSYESLRSIQSSHVFVQFADAVFREGRRK